MATNTPHIDRGSLRNGRRSDLEDLLGPEIRDMRFRDRTAVHPEGDGLGFSSISANGIIFIGCDFDMTDIDRSTFVGSQFIDCSFKGAWLHDVDFTRAFFVRCDLSEAQAARSYFEQAYMRNCSVDQADLSAANMDGVNISDCSFRKTKLVGAGLSRAQLTGDFTEARFDRATAAGSITDSHTSFRRAVFDRAAFTNFDFRASDCGGAIFHYTDLNRTDLTRAKLHECEFAHAQADRQTREWLMRVPGFTRSVSKSGVISGTMPPAERGGRES